MSGHYIEALSWIKQNSGNSGATGLAKMVLSLYNSDCGFAFSECAGSVDASLRALCVKMCDEYSRMGETEELRQVGKEVADRLYPRLWKQGTAMADARRVLLQEWESEDQEKRDRIAKEREENRADEKLIEDHDELRGTYR